MSGPQFVHDEQQGSTLVVTPQAGFVNIVEPAAAREWEAAKQKLDLPFVRHVVVDLGELPYFGSTVLEGMAQMWKRIKAKGGRLAIARASPIGREVLAA